ncbi:protein-tyrosine-phosphatase [Parvularcula sp. ZS-1/3]|uniref:Protein-tyrosine-phosphatase n=1 Tax=Parvularcula mediterranea TaxID=2732508 RepID=A0A7Y3RLY1_9PROT|nr:metallophosphoesterase [Parvularcula mediterranea]NNU16514.1 protein-tyrosine-phosphatase [Parvularcula mediterranea]
MTVRIFALVLALAVSIGAARAERIVAIGDIHGDYDAYIAVLTEAGLVDDRLRWSGGDTVLVQLGDVPDRGPDTRKILDHLMRLEKQAKRKGGKIVPLIGNHEAMNITGDLRYVDPGEYAAFVTGRSERTRDRFYARVREQYAASLLSRDPTLTPEQIRARFDELHPLGYVEHRQAWAPGGDYGRWVADNDAVALIDGTLFVHGGMSEGWIETSLDAINFAVGEALSGLEAEAEIIASETSPLWYRGNVEGSLESEAEVDRILAAYGAERIVVGHTPQLEGIRSFYGGKVIAADTGMSDHYGGTRSWLLIDEGSITAVDNGTRRVLEGEGNP